MSTQGWRTSDEQEREVRRLRAQAEPMEVRKLTPGHQVFADFSVRRTDQDQPQRYIVEIRSLEELTNFCTCPDFAKNSLGTCKHIEKVVAELTKRSTSTQTGSPFVEIYMGRSASYKPQVTIPGKLEDGVVRFLQKYLSARGEFKPPWQNALQVFLRDLHETDHQIANVIRVSREVYELADELQRRENLVTARQLFQQEVLDGERSLQVLRQPLYDYQVKGMMHLAFTGRAMLCDEMGLGKTVQAIAAARIMRDLWKIRRVLIVCPASLKSEWEEQIHKFTDDAVSLIFGPPADRRRIYERTRDFFIVLNYEQVLQDEEALNTVLRPDLIILDESQRIKNWQTQTARSIKRLDSEFAFVLTGTPLENRIDEIYSIVEFINPRIFGSLFRFNRDFYELDEEGKVSGHKNLHELHERLRPIMLRRRKHETLGELPARIDNNFFVQMTEEQRRRYEAEEARAAYLINQARERSLAPADYARLQKHLNCMRMLCDSPFILDQTLRDAPKIDELVDILDDIWAVKATRKVIVFSEWHGMLELVKQRLERAGIGYAWHTGSVPQRERHREVERFREDEECRVFLSTDSGATGLNLQAASVVVNLDLPWNPAKLEQRIARAWRTHQKNTVSVINLIAEDSIEHRMLATLEAKQTLADGVLDGEGDLDNLELPGARRVFLQRLEDVVDTRLAQPEEADEPPPPATDEEPVATPAATATQRRPTPADVLRQELTVALDEQLVLFRARLGEDHGIQSGFIVVEGDGDKARHLVQELVSKTHRDTWTPEIQVLSRQDYALLQRLTHSGLVTLHDQGMQDLHCRDEAARDTEAENARRRRLAEPLIVWAERQARLASCLEEGGFLVEAIDPMREAIDFAARGLVILCSRDSLTRAPESFADTWLPALRDADVLTPEQGTFLTTFRSFKTDQAGPARGYLQTGQALLKQAQHNLSRLRL